MSVANQRKLKAREVQDIYKRYWLQENVHAIAQSHGISERQVYRIGNGLCHAGITEHEQRQGRRQRAKLPDNLVELYERYSLEMLATELECSRYLVRDELVKRGATIRESRSFEARQMAWQHRHSQIYETIRAA